MGIPCKTAAGHAELAGRQRGLSQRHRTLLFLVDGKRSVDEVISLGAQAGVPKAYLDELMALGLVVLAAPVRPLPGDVAPAPALLPDLIDEGDLAFGEESDTGMLGLPLSNTELAALDETDIGFARARAQLLELLRQHGPVTAAITMLRVRRSRDRTALRALLPEIRVRLLRGNEPPGLRASLEEAERWLTP